MYKITTPTGETYLTEKLTYVRKHSGGVFLITDQKRAEGVGYQGNFYLFSDGAQVCEVDAGETLASTQQSVVDADSMNVDQEYRLTLLELGLVE